MREAFWTRNDARVSVALPGALCVACGLKLAQVTGDTRVWDDRDVVSRWPAQRWFAPNLALTSILTVVYHTHGALT